MLNVIVGVQETFKLSSSVFDKEGNWLQVSSKISELIKNLKINRFSNKLTSIVSILHFDAGHSQLEGLLTKTRNFLHGCDNYHQLATQLTSVSLSGLLNLNKFLSVIIKVFCEIMTNGFCPIKDLDDGPSKTSNDFKSSEEETGLGQGEGSKDVSDQIENEDMLDGAYQDPKDADTSENENNKEEDNGIEMSDNFESNMQDKKEEDEEGDDSDKEENELEDETGEVEGNE